MRMRVHGWLVVAALAARVLCVSPAGAEGVSVEEATPEQVQSAQQEFQEGDRLFDVQQYEGALEKYRASYDVVASPNSRLMIARALLELGRLAEAHAEYEATLADAEEATVKHDKYERTAQAARDELEALRSRVARLKVDLGDVPADARITVSGREVSAESLDAPLVLTPGQVVIEAQAPDGQQARVVEQVAAGREMTVTLKLGEVQALPESEAEPAPEPEPVSTAPAQATADVQLSAPSSSLKTYGYVAGGVGVLGWVAFGVFGAMNNSAFSDLESDCTDNHCPPDRDSDIDAGRTYQTVANVGAIVGVLGIGAGATLFYLGHRQEQAAHAAVQVGPGSITLRGRF